MLLKFSKFLKQLNEGFNIESDFIHNKLMSVKSQILNLAAHNKTNDILSLLNREFKNQFNYDTKSKLNIDNVIKELEAEIEYRKTRVEKLSKYAVLRDSARLELDRTRQVLDAFRQKKNKKIKILFYTWKTYHNYNKLSFIQKIGLWFYRRSLNELTYGHYTESTWIPKVRHYKFGVLFGEYNFVYNTLTIVFDDDLAKRINNQRDHFEKFSFLITDVLHHELAHKADMLNMGIREMKSKRQLNSQIEYLSDESELEAHASEAYNQLKRQFNDKEIKEMLNNPLEIRNRTKLEVSNALSKYLMLIYEAPSVYLLFVDKIMDNMEKYYRSSEIL